MVDVTLRRARAAGSRRHASRWLGGARVRRAGLAGVPGRAPAARVVGGRWPAGGPARVTGSAVPRPAPTRSPRPGSCRRTAGSRRGGPWWSAAPEANVILVTGRVFDVLDVPAARGLRGARPDGAGRDAARPGGGERGRPGAVLRRLPRRARGGRTNGGPATWTASPTAWTETGGLRWHCRDSYVLAPPSRLGNDGPPAGFAEPAGRPLPDAVRLLEYLAELRRGMP